MKSTKDKLAILWAYFGALTFGTIFMIGESPNITGYTLKVYNHVAGGYNIISSLILSMYVVLIIYAIKEGKIYKKL